MVRGVCLALLVFGVLPLSMASGEESAVCRQASKYAASDLKNSLQCAMAPVSRDCTASVGGKVFHGSAIGCESPLTGVLEGLCRATVPLPREITIECSAEGWGGTVDAWQVLLNTETGEIRGHRGG